MVPPVMYSTGTPVSAVNFLPMMLATMSRQLPPQTLTTSLSCAYAAFGTPTVNERQRTAQPAQSVMQMRFMFHHSSHDLPGHYP